ncbi:hypothetical protein NKH77_15425 [Streptomyces sp. M19]
MNLAKRIAITAAAVLFGSSPRSAPPTPPPTTARPTTTATPSKSPPVPRTSPATR